MTGNEAYDSIVVGGERGSAPVPEADLAGDSDLAQLSELARDS
jgi:hypothetical protein